MESTIHQVNRRKTHRAWVVSWSPTPRRKGGSKRFATHAEALEYLTGPRIATRAATLEHVDRAGWRTPYPVPAVS